MTWTKIEPTNAKNARPMERVGHSAVLHNDKTLVVFGGKNEDNEKMNDTWTFDLSTKTWTKIEIADKDSIPSHRSGHSAVMSGDYMMIFGGIFEITKELNDAYLFDIKTHKWILFYGKKLVQSNIMIASPSPTKSAYSFS